ncbi:MerR family transcriptional regulator [Paenibacillus sp. WC2504]|uniref:MerR family transcriptional regulator n=1 Tax=Paenibacillus sp. WC2504 TaxID=3461403 RepID=UPI0040466EB9
MKRSYKLTEIAGKIGKTRASVVEWSNHFREFLPIVAVDGSLRYTEEAIEMFRVIARMKDANKPLKFIKEQLQEMRDKEALALPKDIQTAQPETPASPPSPAISGSITPPLAVNKSNAQFNNDTIELRNSVQLLKQKIESNKTTEKLKDYADNLNQKASIASVTAGRASSPAMDHSNFQFDLLTHKFTELSAIVHSLMQKVIKTPEQTSQEESLITTVEALDTRYHSVSDEIADLRNEIQRLAQSQEQVQAQVQAQPETSEIDLKGEILSAATELLRPQVEGVSEEVQKLGNRCDALTEEVTELSSVNQILVNKIAELIEQDIRSEIATTIELLHRQFEGASLKVKGLQNVIQAIQQQIQEASEQDVKGELLIATTQLLNQQYEGVTGEMNQLKDDLNKKYDDMFQKMTAQQRLLDKIAEFLGYPVIN